MKTIINIIFFLIFSSIFLNADDVYLEKKVDCIILEDENSIICKYIHERIEINKEVFFRWIEPNGTITRYRSVIIPAGHGSVYDFRYIKGRTNGSWTVEVVDNNQTFKTNFILE